jgi:hypothetical protein
MRRRRGSSLIEFALGLVVLAPVTVEVARWGATAYVLHEMQSAAGEGAAFASTAPTTWGVRDLDFERRVRNVVLYGNPGGGERARIAGLRAENIQVTVMQERGLPRTVEVSIRGYEAPGRVLLRLDGGPRVSMPYRGRISGR